MATVQDTNYLLQTAQSSTKSRATSSWKIVKSTIWKDLVVMKRYKANLIGQLIRTLLFILVFWFFSVAIEFNDLANSSSKNMYLFYLAGFSLMMFDGVALWTPYQTVTRDLYNGTLESIYMSPSSRYAYFFGSVGAQAVISSLFFIPIFISLVWISGIGAGNIVMILLVVLVAVGTLTFFGIVVALLAILWKQTGSIIGIIGTLFTFLAGGLFPVSSFPKILIYFSYLLPYTWGFDLIRYYAFDGTWEPLIPIMYEWIILAGMGFLLFFTSRRMLGKVELYAKKNGLHLL